MIAPKILLAVYDHLRRDGNEHKTYMEDAKYLGTWYTDPEYDLYSTQVNYPGLVKEGSTSILLEIFEVDAATIKNCDYFEGYNEYNYMCTFKRETIETPFGNSFIYIYNKPIIGKPNIESGDWLKYKKEIKQKLLTEKKTHASRWSE
jgi:gamma-glutamylcyclotransferase (GGCT)/AIG2-like uncharacterized protein YtfP